MGFWEKASDSSLPPVVIAEFGDSHFGHVGRAKKMCTMAKEAGADVAKFQHHIVEEEMLRDVPMSANMQEPLWDFLSKNALSIDQHVDIALFCKDIGLDYLCTPFSLAAANELEKFISPSSYKIGSGELLDHPTIEAISRFGKPMILSTGMANLEEVDETYEFMSELQIDFALLSCTSGYPPEIRESNLGFQKMMAERYPKALIGSSDHFPGLEVTIASVAIGARIIEKHITDDTSEYGPDTNSSITFEQLKDLVNITNGIHHSLLSEKTIHPSEEVVRSWAHRSLVYLGDLSKGHVLTERDIWGKRPGTGIPSRFRSEVMGKKLSVSVTKNSLLQWGHFE